MSDTEDSTDVEIVGYFPGDTGTLAFEARRAYVQLIRKTYISSLADPEAWEAVLEYEDEIRARMNELFLELRVDRQREIAMKWQVSAEESGVASLIRPLQYSPEQAAVMLLAREALLRTRTGDTEDGQMRAAAWLEVDDVVDTVLTYPAVADNRRDRAASRVRNAIEYVRGTGVLLGGPDATRLQISPVAELLLPIEKLEELSAWFVGGFPDQDALALDEDDEETEGSEG